MQRIFQTLTALVFLVGSMVFAHAELESSLPSAGDTIKTLPKAVEIAFGEAIEVKLSSFKVYRLQGSFATLKTAQTAATALVKKVLGAKGDQAQRSDDGLVTTAENTSKIQIKLKSGLPAGTYVVMWKVLSVDGHVLSDYFLFTYKP